MVRVTDELALSPEHVTLYHATDPLLGHLPVLIFHGPSTTANYTSNSSRVQVHVYTLAGYQSFPRLTISPNSPFYNVVNYLPREFQVDEVYRALAFGLFRYFLELPENVKSRIRQQYPTTRGRRPGSAPALFGEQHAADIAKSMVKTEGNTTSEVIQTLQSALQVQHISNVDIDLVLPPGSIIPLQPADFEDVPEDEDDILDPTLRQYGMYHPLIKLFGEPMFLPTSRLRRAPSKPSALNRTKSFSKDQKVELRHKLAELVDTEERYVLKVNELVKHLADEYRQKAESRTDESFSPSLEDVEKLFPRSSETILQMNTAFMKELRKIMDETEEEALEDIESGAISRVGISGSLSGKSKDPSGALAIAKTMLQWFPQFTDCYQDYIRASQNFPQLISSFVSQQSSFSQRVAQTGEQHLRSTLIEPVQRLPRYSLVIDQIVGCLPITHPALQPMLKARDIIANICSMDDPLADKPQVSSRLRNMIESWPQELEPTGRLTVAADFRELPAPYQFAESTELDDLERNGIFLLFSDCLVIVKKVFGSTMTGRDLLREIDKPSAAGLLASMTNAAGGPASYELAFAGWHEIADVRFTESPDGRTAWMTSCKDMKGAHAGDYVTSTAATTRCFVLQESYEGKASKWTEDVVKARVEGRFAEAEREDPSWTLRTVRMPDTGLGLYAAVFQEGLDQLVEGRKEPAPIRIVVDHEKGTKGSPVGHYGVEICSDVKTGDFRKLVIITAGLHGKKSTDEIALEDFLPTLARRIIQLLSNQFTPANQALTPALTSFHTKVLRGLNLSKRVEKSRSFLSSSPVKLLSNFLNGGAAAEATIATTKHQRTPLGNVSTLFPGQISRTNSAKDSSSLYGSIKSRDGYRIMVDDNRPENPLVRLELTFTGYMVFLQEQKGRFVGRTLLNRSATDELSVNDLYNKLIENPSDLDASSELTADVVFAAFEKFVRIAWREQMGPIISRKALDALQERASKRVPGDFGDFVHYLFSDMAPQNRRAFTSLVKLLADLLDGCGNDSDRGALTLAFAELLVDDGSAHEYINLLDRLVEDCERIFDDGSGGLGSSVSQSGSAFESMNSVTRSMHSYTGSTASATSSIRRKLGLDTLLRQNSKSDADTRSSVWRSLSKHRHPATGESLSLSKGSVNRTRSIDIAPGTPGSPNKLRRPQSRDRPPIAGAFAEDPFTRPTSSHQLDDIGESEEATKRLTKKKRRSSLSDLKSLMAAATLEDEPLPPLSLVKQTSEKFNSSPRSGLPSRIPVSPNRKENAADGAKVESSPAEPRMHTKNLSTSNIPTLKSSRGAGSSPQKLRLQSPQKLRERLQQEKKAVEEVDTTLHSELSKISADMAKVNSATPRSPTTDIRTLQASVAALEEKVPSLVAELTKRQEAIQRDTESMLKATEGKVKAIDQLYKESKAENELLYERFNNELAKIVKALKGKGEREELMTKMKESSEETARVKKENARLRREIVSLRMLAKGGGAPEDA